MRKPGFIFSLLLSCVILMLTGCAGQAEKKPVDNTDYKISKQSYIDRSIMINYPQIIGMSDHEKQEKINKLIKTEAFYILNWYSEEQLNSFSLDLDCEIKVEKPEILSIAYSGLRYLKGTAHPTFVFFTTNINMRDGSKVRINDLININNDLAEKIKDGRYSPKSAQFPLERVKEIVSKDVLPGLHTADWPGYPQNRGGIYTYFTSSYLGVSVEIPHPYGDHIEIEVPYQDIIRHIKSENKVWESLY